MDRSLRAVVAALRAGSLSAAAAELDMTQAAVSQAVKRAETLVGVPLLVRSRTGVEATPAAADSLASLAAAYEAIDRDVAELRRTSTDPTVSISVSTSFATWWLLPRLPEFKREHPEIALRLVTTDTDAGVDMSDVDLWIPLGLVEREDLEGVELCDEALVPVAAPEVASRHRRWTIDDLAAGPLLHLEERYTPRFDWPRWFAEHGVAAASARRAGRDGDRTTDYSLVLHSALGGQGIALGWKHLVADLIADGRLVALADPVQTEHPFLILNRRGRALRDDVAVFRQWLVDTMGA